MSELTDHLGLPASAPADQLRAVALAFLAGDSTAIPQPKRARLILAARRATGETFPAKRSKQERVDRENSEAEQVDVERNVAPCSTCGHERLRHVEGACCVDPCECRGFAEETGQLRKAAGVGLPCRPPCKGTGRLAQSMIVGRMNATPVPDGWEVRCACGRTATGRTAGEAVAEWSRT